MSNAKNSLSVKNRKYILDEADIVSIYYGLTRETAREYLATWKENNPSWSVTDILGHIGIKLQEVTDEG